MSAKRGNRRKTIYDEEMRTVVQDLQYSVRQLVRSPGLALTALMSLALGIGATTAVFSVIYAGLINPYPFTAADRIVRLTMQSRRARRIGSISMGRRSAKCGSLQLSKACWPWITTP